MHFQFLIEDLSGEILIAELMTKLQKKYSSLTFDLKSFQGIGHLPRGKSVKQIKSGKLLNSLPSYLKGFDKALKNIPAALFVVLDNDGRDCEVFQSELHKLAWQCAMVTDYVFCIAIEEIEAWLIGDVEAIFAAYPQLFRNVRGQQKSRTIKSCASKSAHGTWEDLAEIVCHGGAAKLKELGYPEIGIKKREWAQKIGSCMEWERNTSPSFLHFKDEIMKRVNR